MFTYSGRPYAALFRSHGDRYTPNRRPARRAASETSRTTSPLALRHALERTQCLVVLVGHKQKPSWCLAVRITPAMPAAANAATIASASKAAGLKTDGSS